MHEPPPRTQAAPPPTETEHRLTASDGAELAYWRWSVRGEPQPCLLLLHGAASNHTRWSEFLERTRLKGSWDALRPDLRGNGASLVRGRLDLDIWSRDLAEILDAEGRDAALLVGHSLGAQIALHFGHRFPERTMGLVLIDPVFNRALIGKRRRLHRARRLIAPVVAMARALNALGLRRRRIVAQRDLRELDEETREALHGGEGLEEIARRYSALGPILRHMPVANYLQQLNATSADLPPLTEIRQPVLVILSAGITFADPRINRREIARFPAADTVEVDANHWPLTEKPEEVREAIDRWVETRFARRPPRGRGSGP